MARAVHSKIGVLDETRSLAFCEAAFGLHVADRLEFESFTLICLSNSESDFELELTVNKGRSAPYDLGNGCGHLAVVVAEVATEYATLDSRRASWSISAMARILLRGFSSSPIPMGTRSR